MAFTNNFRIERVYFERLKTMIDVLKAFKGNVTDEPTRTILENSIDVDGATLLLYRNLGEAWAELADLIQKTREMLHELDAKAEAYHDELNERIDEVNNYLMALIRALEARVDAIEADLAQMGRLFTYELERENDAYTLTESGAAVTFADTVAKYTHNRAHLVTVRGNVDGETTYFFPREYDTNTESGLFEWYAFGFVGNEIHEITVTLLPDNTVNVAIETTDFSAILSRLSALEASVASLIQHMTNAEADIDTLEETVENLQENKQDKLVAGSGISIDPDTNEIMNTAQGALYNAGLGIRIADNTLYTKNGAPYTLSPLIIPIDFTGRFDIGDLSNDNLVYAGISVNLRVLPDINSWDYNKVYYRIAVRDPSDAALSLWQNPVDFTAKIAIYMIDEKQPTIATFADYVERKFKFNNGVLNKIVASQVPANISAIYRDATKFNSFEYSPFSTINEMTVGMLLLATPEDGTNASALSLRAWLNSLNLSQLFSLFYQYVFLAKGE